MSLTLISNDLTLTKLQNGSAGANGYNAATIYLYQRSATQPLAPTSTLTYTFATGALSPSAALGSWKIAPDDGNDPCWVAIAAAISNISTDEINTDEWTIRELVENGVNGIDGYNQATIYLYQRTTASSVSAPTGYSYTFSTDTISPTLTTWSRAIPPGTDPCWVTSAVVVSRTDNNNQLNFVTPTLMVKNGANGASGINCATVYLYQRSNVNTPDTAPAKPNGNVRYEFSTGAVTGSLNYWTNYIPEGTTPCYMIIAQATAPAGTSYDDIASTEWSEQKKIVQNGANGAPGADGVTITGTAVHYIVSNNGNTPPGPSADWSDTIPSSIPDQSYLWTRTTVSYSDSTPDTVSYSVSYKAKNGTNGTSVTITSKSIQYKVLDIGTGDPGSTGWSNNIPSANPGQYLWTRTIVNYSDGNSTTAYSVSKMGINGTNGYNTATVFLYKRGVPTSPATNLSGPTGTLTYYFTTGQLDASDLSYFNGWSQSVPEVNNNKEPCWVITAAAISQGSSIDISTNQWSQSVKLVEDGEDANSLRIITNTESILKFPVDRNDKLINYSITPDTINISLKDKENDVASNLYTTINIYLNEIDLNNIIEVGNLNRYLIENGAHEYYTFNIDQLYNEKNSEYIQDNYKDFLNDFFGTSIPTYIKIQIEYNDSYAYKYLIFQTGITEEAARLSVEADGIFASIVDAGLIFDSNGLIISNGNFIIKYGNEEKLYFNSNDGSLRIVGNGIFTGTVHATDGEFTGTITSTSGNIGGFKITENTIKSDGLTLTAAYNDNGTLVPSSINVENIILGSGAQVADYLNIGNLSLLNPLKNNNIVLRLSSNGINYFTLNNNGEIEGANWSIKEQGGLLTATFDRLVAQNGSFSGIINATNGYFQGEIVSSIISASTINTANFITEKIRSMGGAYIFKPTFEIIDYNYVDDGDYIDNNNSSNNLYKFKFILNNSVKEYFEALDLNETNIIGVSGNDIRYGKINSINDSTNNYEVYVYFYEGDFNILKNSDNKYNTLTLLGEIGDDTLNTIIGINSDNIDTILAPRALSMMQINSFQNSGESNSGYLTYNSNLLLGDLRSIINNGQQLSGYGLYADNVYLRGSLTTNTSTDATYAGVNTEPNVTFNYATWNQENNTNNDNEKIIFWGGANGFDSTSINKAPFVVTNKGNIYARGGEFKGTIIANSVIARSIIQASTIEGVGDSPSLKIYDTGNKGGIGFYKKNGDLLTLTINNTGFYHGSDDAFIEWNESNSNVIANIYQLKTGNTSIVDGIIKQQIENGIPAQLNLNVNGNDKYAQLKYDTGSVKVTNGLVTITESLNISGKYNDNEKILDYKINSEGYYSLTVR